MLIHVINPNTTATMTTRIGECAAAVAAVGTSVVAINPTMGPASIESHYDEALAVPGLLTEIAAGELAGVDGYVIACFGDPGLEAAREVASGPVVGIAEGAMLMAGMLGRGFTVVTTLQRTVGRAWDLAHRYGMAGKCLNVRACEVPVLELETAKSFAQQQILQQCRDAVTVDGADSIVLGCAGMADLCSMISAEVGVPVIDGVAAATKLVESLVALGLKTSKVSEFAKPLPKSYSGLLTPFALGVPA